MVISAELFNDAFRSLSIYEQALLLYLAVRANHHSGQCNPSHQTILRDLDMGKNVLLRSLAKLEQASYLKRTPGVGRCQTTRYEIGLSEIGISGNTVTVETTIGLQRKPQKRERRKENIATVISIITPETIWTPQTEISKDGEESEYRTRVDWWITHAKKDENWRADTKAAFPALTSEDFLGLLEDMRMWLLQEPDNRRPGLNRTFRQFCRNASRDKRLKNAA